MEPEDQRTLVLSAAVDVDGRKTLPCAKALELTQKNAISLPEIGAICDAEDVKITHCQLGCFR